MNFPALFLHLLHVKCYPPKGVWFRWSSFSIIQETSSGIVCCYSCQSSYNNWFLVQALPFAWISWTLLSCHSSQSFVQSSPAGRSLSGVGPPPLSRWVIWWGGCQMASRLCFLSVLSLSIPSYCLLVSPSTASAPSLFSLLASFAIDFSLSPSSLSFLNLFSYTFLYLP